MVSTTLHHMFLLSDVTLLEKILRPIAVYVFLVIGLRLAGKRELASLNPFDFVVLLTLSNTVQNAIIGNDNSVTGGMIGAATLLIVNYVVVRGLYRHERLESLVEGTEDVLIDNGQILRDRLRQELITENELLSAANKQGFATLAEIQRAVIEPGGTVLFVAKKPTADSIRHDELIAKLDRLGVDLAALRLATGRADV